MGDVFMTECAHNLWIYNREKIDVADAQEILSSTDKEIYVKLSEEILQILGDKMKINKLVPEEKMLSVSGKINGVNYVSKPTKKSIFKRVFK